MVKILGQCILHIMLYGIVIHVVGKFFENYEETWKCHWKHALHDWKRNQTKTWPKKDRKQHWKFKRSFLAVQHIEWNYGPRTHVQGPTLAKDAHAGANLGYKLPWTLSAFPAPQQGTLYQGITVRLSFHTRLEGCIYMAAGCRITTTNGKNEMMELDPWACVVPHHSMGFGKD